MRHHLASAPDTVRFGIFDAAFDPVLTVAPGDTVVIDCVSGGPEVMPGPDAGLAIPPALRAIHDARLERIGPHILTGPVAIAGAEPGDTLEVRIEAIEPNNTWGYCAVRPLAGTLPDEFPERYVSHIAVDAAAGTCKPAWGPTLPLRPFFGTTGVAPPARYGRLSSREPREHGGNMDCKELVAGSTLFLPVWVPGANFSAGDGHGRQGDGEVCVNALEMGLTGTFTFVLHKAAHVGVRTWPSAESPTHYLTLGFNEDLDLAMKQALRGMIDLIVSRSSLSRVQAYQFCSLAVDFRVTQTVNGEKGVHGMLEKGVLF
ncbi:amidase [Caulobacter sp. Root1455]|uniref:acetamidase/formamidase family protein n=1 Tax=unclassified Caulobacter TaxID=2648921 RepID=UPI0006F310D8|nr:MULTISPECIES: acetamidase/formamidase family protein [unclassified Caulobacter]KQY34396.1 amidase [Caulobacter sp. Root487D2Y]KQZ03270.1 amidase [Caulobacter sp. Root1455]